MKGKGEGKEKEELSRMTYLHFIGYLRQVALALVRCDDVAGQGLFGYPLRRLHAYRREFNSCTDMKLVKKARG